MQGLGIVPGHSQMPQVTFRQQSSQMRLGSEKRQPDRHIVYVMPDVVPNSSQMESVTPISPISIHHSV